MSHSIPTDWPRLSVSIFYRDPAKAIDWLCQAFGFEVRLKIESEPGQIEHSELTLGGKQAHTAALVMVGKSGRRDKRVSPLETSGSCTQAIMIYVEDVDGLAARAKAAGAKIAEEPKTTDYGDDYWSDRSCDIEDLEGHRWYFCERVRSKKQ